MVVVWVLAPLLGTPVSFGTADGRLPCFAPRLRMPDPPPPSPPLPAPRRCLRCVTIHGAPCGGASRRCEEEGGVMPAPNPSLRWFVGLMRSHQSPTFFALAWGGRPWVAPLGLPGPTPRIHARITQLLACVGLRGCPSPASPAFLPHSPPFPALKMIASHVLEFAGPRTALHCLQPAPALIPPPASTPPVSPSYSCPARSGAVFLRSPCWDRGWVVIWPVVPPSRPLHPRPSAPSLPSPEVGPETLRVIEQQAAIARKLAEQAAAGACSAVLNNCCHDRLLGFCGFGWPFLAGLAVSPCTMGSPCCTHRITT